MAMMAILSYAYYSLDIRLARTSGIRIYDFSSSWDAHIPLLPGFFWIYLLYYPFCFLCIGFLSTREHFYRIAGAFFLEFALAMLVYVFFPSRMIRPDIPAHTFTLWALSLFYRVDPGYNIFPSLHVANAALVAWVFHYYESRWSGAAIVLAILISISTVFVKAHYILDIPAGLALAAAAIALAWAGSRRDPADPDITPR